MARIARNTQKSSIFHIVQQTNKVLFRNLEDRTKFLEIVEQTKSKYQFYCYGFSCCMDYRFELVIQVVHQSISKIMQSILISYSKYYKENITLFPKRYQSMPLFSYQDVTKALESLNDGMKNPKTSICFYSSQKDTSYKLIDFFTKTSISIDVLPEAIPLDVSLNTFLNDNGCSKLQLIEDIELRNKCILKIYRDSGCTIKKLSEIFSMSPSMISKILKKEAN